MQTATRNRQNRLQTAQFSFAGSDVLKHFRFGLRHFAHNGANVELVNADYSCDGCDGFHGDAVQLVLGEMRRVLRGERG